MELKIRIIEVKDVKLKDGRTFKAYKTVGKNGRKMDARFVQGCTNVPTEPCFIYVDDNECNVDTTRQYPILWVKNVLRTESFTRKSNVTEFFDTEPPISPDGEEF